MEKTFQSPTNDLLSPQTTQEENSFIPQPFLFALETNSGIGFLLENRQDACSGVSGKGTLI